MKIDQTGQVQRPDAEYFVDLYKSTPGAKENKDDFRIGMSEFYKQHDADPNTPIPTSANSLIGAGSLSGKKRTAMT